MAVRNKSQLITYPDSLGGDLRTLGHVLDRYFPEMFEGGIHILPPFPSSGDRGFAPLTHLQIDPRFGSWREIKEIGDKHPVLLDLVVNHMSSKSPYFQDYLQNGPGSPYAGLFIPIEKYWPNRTPSKKDIEGIFLRRPSPFSEYPIKATGETRTLWTTFGKTDPSEQVDIDVDSPIARNLMAKCVSTFGKHQVRMVRLDAVGYVIKKIGTSCFFVEPEIFQFLEWLKSTADEFGIEVLPELHTDLPTQTRLAQKGYWTYDFVLPYLILEAFVLRDSNGLKAYLAVRRHRQFTMLDCHDGVPIKPDLNGLYDPDRARRVTQICIQRGANLSKVFSPKFRDPDGFDVHQIRGTYYSLLGSNDQAYLAARALQFFVPGIPQVYYVGLLAGENDEIQAQGTGDGREINRHNYTLEEIDRAVQRPVVQNLIRLTRFRDSHPAFNGKCSLDTCSDHEVLLRWDHRQDYARLHIDLRTDAFEITHTDPGSHKATALLFR
jgi:sucrose 6(F)-phosphate phosphorylase